MKKTNFLLFLIGISFCSCKSATNPMPNISTIETDFPITEKLEFKPFNKYNILKDGNYMIDDSVLWHFFYNDEHSVGECYDLNTGEKLSTIAMRGKAAHEFVHLNFYASKIMGDSIQLSADVNTIKTFYKKDIIENKPMNERGFSVTMAPDSINVGRIIKLPNNSILTTIAGTPEKDPLPEKYNINNKSVAIFNNNEAKGYETINYDSFDIKLSDAQLEDYRPNFIIKNAYAYGNSVIKDNNLAAFSVFHQFILYTLDLNTGNVVNEKRYTDMQNSGVSHKTTNDLEMQIGFMESNDKYILCATRGYFSEKDKESKQLKYELFVFDWDLKPIKRFELPNVKGNIFIVSNDCSSIYVGTFSDDDGLTLTKADLKI